MISQQNFLCGLTGLSQKCEILRLIQQKAKKIQEIKAKFHLYCKKTLSLTCKLFKKLYKFSKYRFVCPFIAFTLKVNKKIGFLLRIVFRMKQAYESAMLLKSKLRHIFIP